MKKKAAAGISFGVMQKREETSRGGTAAEYLNGELSGDKEEEEEGGREAPELGVVSTKVRFVFVS